MSERTDARAQDRLSSDRSLRPLLAALLALHALVAIYFAKDALLPVVLGFLIALTLSPIARTLARSGVPAPIAAAAMISALGGALLLGAYTMSGTVNDWIEQAPALGERVKERLSGVAASVEAVKDATKEVEGLTEASSASYVQKVVVQQPGLLSSAVSNVAGAGTSLAVALVLALFLLSSGSLFYEKLINSFSSLSEKKNALKSVYDLEQRISRYLFTVTIINACLGCAIATAAFALGMPYAPVWGLLAFLLNYLPFLGSVIGTALIAAVSIVTFDDLGYAFLAPAAYLALGTLEGQIITPAIVGRRLEINTVSVFLAVIFWAWLWGIAGALLAVPLLVVFKVVCDNVASLKAVGDFLSVGHTPPKEAPVTA